MPDETTYSTAVRFLTLQNVLMNNGKIPDAILEGIRMWVDYGYTPGDFLQAVLRNDLQDACGRADDYNRWILFDIVSHLYNECPAPCWGSPEKVKAWKARFGPKAP